MFATAGGPTLKRSWTGCCSSSSRATRASRKRISSWARRTTPRGATRGGARVPQDLRRHPQRSPGCRRAAPGRRRVRRPLAPPELDPSYGQTALATYQELVNRYPGTSAATRAQGRIADLQERFAYKEYRAALYYFKLKAYDSAILYLKDVVATYPRAAIAPEALVKLVQAYQKLGYKEDMQETCGYIRRFHPDAAKSHGVCPPDSTGAS